MNWKPILFRGSSILLLYVPCCSSARALIPSFQFTAGGKWEHLGISAVFGLNQTAEAFFTRRKKSNLAATRFSSINPQSHSVASSVSSIWKFSEFIWSSHLRKNRFYKAGKTERNLLLKIWKNIIRSFTTCHTMNIVYLIHLNTINMTISCCNLLLTILPEYNYERQRT